MSWMTPAAKAAMKLGIFYAPHVKTAWDTAGRPMQSAMQTQAMGMAAQRQAYKEAATLVEGTVLRLAPGGMQVWVVYSGDLPVSAYPPPMQVLKELVAHADLTKRRTPEEHREAQLGARAQRASKKAGRLGVRTATEVGRKTGLAATSLAQVPKRLKGATTPVRKER